MEIRLEFPPGTIVETVTTPTGAISAIKVQPFFPSSRATAVLSDITVKTGGGRLVDQSTLAVAGASGLIRLRKRTQSAVPLFDLLPNPTEPVPKKEKPSEPDKRA